MIADPLGTVGAVGQWANQASLGTLGASRRGRRPTRSRTLADSMRTLFAGAIEMPWCYLEFGNVRWCSDPALLDPRSAQCRLEACVEAQRRRRSAASQASSRPSCVSGAAGASRLMTEHSDELLREADTNGELFLAFPANGPQRNSVKESSSLLHVLCQAEDDTKCTGATAAQAEFRSDSGTIPRVIGVALIAAGVLGMVLLFGLIAVHLLVAAVISLMMLLLAPLVVLAPALGDGGRAVFGAWLTRLLGAVSSKLLFSFLLGALLTLQRILTSLQPLGWWTDWLLISTFWWAAFLKRHRAFAVLRARGSAPLARDRRTVGQRLEAVGRAQTAARHPLRWARSKVFPPLPVDEQPRRRAPAGSRRHGKQAEGRMAQVARGTRISEHTIVPHGYGRSRAGAAALGMRAQLRRLRGARERAAEQGDRRRAMKLAVRERRVEAALTREQERPARSGHAGRPDELRVPGPPDSSSSPHARGADEGRDTRPRPDPLEAKLAGDRSAREAPSHDAGVALPRDSVPVAGEIPPGVRGVPRDARERRSPVMDDAHAVAQGRKRQLGFGPDR